MYYWRKQDEHFEELDSIPPMMDPNSIDYEVYLDNITINIDNTEKTLEVLDNEAEKIREETYREYSLDYLLDKWQQG